MNYRHAFHAGNVADVMKHAVLARIIEHLKAKPAPFRLLDLHAGTGLYDLTAEAAERTGEWRDGVGRLYREAVERIRASATDVVINLTAGMGGDLTLGSVEQPLPPGEECRSA